MEIRYGVERLTRFHMFTGLRVNILCFVVSESAKLRGAGGSISAPSILFFKLALNFRASGSSTFDYNTTTFL